MKTWKMGNWLVCGVALCPVNFLFSSVGARAFVAGISGMFALGGWAISCNHVSYGVDLLTIKRELKYLHRIIACWAIGVLSVFFRWTFPFICVFALCWMSIHPPRLERIKKQLRRITKMWQPNHAQLDGETHSTWTSDEKSSLVCNIMVSRKMKDAKLTQKQVEIARNQIARDHPLFPGATFTIRILEEDELLLETNWEVFDRWWASSMIKARAQTIDDRQGQLLKMLLDAETQIRYLLTIGDFLAAGSKN